MPTSPEAITAAVRAAQRALNQDDAQGAFDRLESLPLAARTFSVLRLQGLCLLLLDRPQQAHDLAVAAQARNPSYPYALLQSADLACHRRDHWPALLAYLEAVQQQPRLPNLWARIIKITTVLASAPAPVDTASSHHVRLLGMLPRLVEQLIAQPADRHWLEGVAHLLALLPADPSQANLAADHGCHALVALRALDTLE